MRRERNIGLGEAVNCWRGQGWRTQRVEPFRQRTARVGITTDVTNIAETLELLDHYDAQDAR